jgi:hypothetical protein
VAQVSCGQKFASSGYCELQVGQSFIRYLVVRRLRRAGNPDAGAKLENLRADAHRKATSDQIFTNENAGPMKRYFATTFGAGFPGSPRPPKSSFSERVDLRLS